MTVTNRQTTTNGEFQLTRSRGAWLVLGVKDATTDDFNSHAHVERDVIGLKTGVFLMHFNSHAHVERDLLSLCLYTAVENFNSHAHVERDKKAFRNGKIT